MAADNTTIFGESPASWRSRRPIARTVFAHNPSVGNGTETVWGVGGQFPWTTTWDNGVSNNVTIKSDDAEDNGAGTGIRTVCVFGQGGDGREKFTDVTLSGTTSVTLGGTWSFISIMQTVGFGSTGAAVGNVTMHYDDAAVIRSIVAGDNRSEGAAGRVPAGMEGFIYRFVVFVATGDTATVTLRVRKAGGPWITLMHPRIQGAVVIFQEAGNEPFFRLDSLEDVEICATSDNASGADVSVLIHFKFYQVA